MTGFYRESGCGSIQLAALAGLLVKSNISMWDLGMSMDYKLEFGASLIDRNQWIRLLREHRLDKRQLECPLGTKISAGDLVSHLTRIHSQ
jgi:Leu/Phe-tRNA-protein transferase